MNVYKKIEEYLGENQSIEMWANSIKFAAEKFNEGKYKQTLKALEDTKKALPKLIKMVKEKMSDTLPRTRI